MTCPSCDTNFSLAGDQTVLSDAAAPKSIGHFELLERLGMGAFGTVWKARDTELDRTVAIKIPRKGQLSAEETELFVREAQAAAQLKHANIVSVHEIGREDDTVYIVSDFVDGLSLADWLSGQQLTSREAAELCEQIAEALHHAHQAGVVHRDLKPSNIMLDSQQSPHIMDFGLAKREAGEITMTADGRILGTPAYMSPEQAHGEAHDADRRSDVYSLGVILFELLTGEPPFRGNVRMLLHQVIHDEPPTPRKLNANVPRDLETICLKCLQKEPHKRYDSAIELAFDLRRFLNGEPISARPVSRRERSWRWCRRNPVVAGLASSLAVALLIAFVGITTQWMRAEESVEQLVAQEGLTQRHLFTAHGILASQAIDNENMLRAVQLLGQYDDEEERPETSTLERRRTHEDLRSFAWHYLWRQSHRALSSVRLELNVDGFYVNQDGKAVVVSSDGRFVAMGGRLRTTDEKSAEVRLYDVRTGAVLMKLQQKTVQDLYSITVLSRRIRSGDVLVSRAE